MLYDFCSQMAGSRVEHHSYKTLPTRPYWRPYPGFTKETGNIWPSGVVAAMRRKDWKISVAIRTVSRSVLGETEANLQKEIEARFGRVFGSNYQ